MDRSRVELKVGVFVFLAIVILVVFIFRIGNLKNYGVGFYSLRFMFGNVSGVKAGSPVRYSGVDVGEVTQVRIIEDTQNKNTKVEVTAKMNKSVRIPEASKVFINTLGLLGEKYIEIFPPPEIGSYVIAGGVLTGVDPAMTQDMIDEAQKIVKDFQELIQKLKEGEGTVGRLLYDDRLYQELEALIVDLRQHPWKLFWKTKEKKK